MSCTNTLHCPISYPPIWLILQDRDFVGEQESTAVDHVTPNIPQCKSPTLSPTPSVDSDNVSLGCCGRRFPPHRGRHQVWYLTPPSPLTPQLILHSYSLVFISAQLLFLPLCITLGGWLLLYKFNLRKISWTFLTPGEVVLNFMGYYALMLEAT